MPCEAPPISLAELLGHVPPVWPWTRPAHRPTLCCENCMRNVVCRAWRCGKALWRLVRDSYVDPFSESETAEQSDDWQDPWPTHLPEELESGDDFLLAAQATFAVHYWCLTLQQQLRAVMDSISQGDGDDAHVRLAEGIDWQVRKCEVWSYDLAELLHRRARGGPWDRQTALRVLEDWVHDMAELVLNKWDY